MIDSYTVYFTSSSIVRDTRCFQFQPVQDMIVEEDEVMTFQALTGNELDMFVSGNSFDLTIYDDDGTLLEMFCMVF